MLSGAVLIRDGAALHVDDSGGDGLPVVFQHGLCGDASQPRDAFPADPALRRITLECRGHGKSEPGDPSRFSIATFADDVACLIEATGRAPLVVGGISMGAAIALRLAVLRPDLVRGLVLARPAWITDAAPLNMAPNAEVGTLLAALPPEPARRTFMAGPTAARLAGQAPDNLASLEGFFRRSPHAITAALLQSIAADGPGVSAQQVRALIIPTLVIGHDQDVIHPQSHAEAITALIPGAALHIITAKARDRNRHASDLRSALHRFLKDFL